MKRKVRWNWKYRVWVCKGEGRVYRWQRDIGWVVWWLDKGVQSELILKGVL